MFLIYAFLDAYNQLKVSLASFALSKNGKLYLKAYLVNFSFVLYTDCGCFHQGSDEAAKMTNRKRSGKDEAMKEKLDSILQPSTQAKEFKITIEFGYKISPNYKKAVGLAKKNPTYNEEGNEEWIRHSATYTSEQVEDLFKLFNLVHEWEKTEVLVNHKKLPYGHQLWLPLMWFYRIN